MSTKFLFPESMEILGKIPQYHAVFLAEALLVLWVAWFVIRRQYGMERRPSDDEVARKLAEFHPEPLISEPVLEHPSLHPRLVTSRMGKEITVDGNKCLNLGTHNYLNLVENKEIEAAAVAAVNKYGVGSCGPRGFYGTVDVHLELEAKLAEFMETEEAVVYSYGFSTIASAIQAYCKRNDCVFVDEKVNFPIQKGLNASRSKVFYFKHNNVQDLEQILMEQDQKLRKDPKRYKKTRKFLIVEGIYMNTGEICPLPELVRLCRKFKLRIFVDESISFGTLGSRGRGVTEHYGVPRDEIDLIMASLEYSVGSIGGFCVGSTFIIEHQILSGLGYCFSASSPPLLTAAAISALSTMTNNPEMFTRLKHVCKMFHNRLSEIDGIFTTSFVDSPVKHLYLRQKMEREEEQKLLLEISEKCLQKNLAVIPPAYLPVELNMPRPSLRVCLCSDLTEDDLDFAMCTLNKCAREVLSNRS